LQDLEKRVREITINGLEWKASQLVDVAYGLQKLKISCVVIDDLVPSTDDVEEKIMALEGLVQSVDVVAFNKV